MNDFRQNAESADSSPVLLAEDLRKTFRDFWGRPRAEAVRGVSLSVGSGEILGMLGPNGSGKSTTIKMALGLLRPTAGTVRLFGLPPSDRRARARVGYLPELSHLHPFLTPRETLLYAAGLADMPRPAAAARAEELLRRVGLDGVAADRRVGEFSKGMARRVGLARALVADPELVVLDEPTSGLDPVGRRDVKDLVKELGREGRTVVLSSHLLSEVQDVCTRIAVLVRGRIRAGGALPGLLEKPGGAIRFTATGLPPEKSADARAALLALGAESVSTDAPTVALEDYFLALLGQSGESAP